MCGGSLNRRVFSSSLSLTSTTTCPRVCGHSCVCGSALLCACVAAQRACLIRISYFRSFSLFSLRLIPSSLISLTHTYLLVFFCFYFSWTPECGSSCHDLYIFHIFFYVFSVREYFFFFSCLVHCYVFVLFFFKCPPLSAHRCLSVDQVHNEQRGAARLRCQELQTSIAAIHHANKKRKKKGIQCYCGASRQVKIPIFLFFCLFPFSGLFGRKEKEMITTSFLFILAFTGSGDVRVEMWQGRTPTERATGDSKRKKSKIPNDIIEE